MALALPCATARLPTALPTACSSVEKACLFIRKQDQFTLTREIKRHVRALARNHPEGWKEGPGVWS